MYLTLLKLDGDFVYRLSGLAHRDANRMEIERKSKNLGRTPHPKSSKSVTTLRVVTILTTKVITYRQQGTRGFPQQALRGPLGAT